MGGLFIIIVVSWIVQTHQDARVNVALKKPTTMSSSLPGTLQSGGAVDGNITTVFPNVIHTAENESSAWWTVDLERYFDIVTVVVYFRTDNKFHRNGMELKKTASKYNTTDFDILCESVTGSPNGSDIPDIVTLECIVRLRYLRIFTETDNDGKGAVLDFSEVEVFVACSPGWYGPNCTRSCPSDNQECDRTGQNNICVFAKCETTQDGIQYAIVFVLILCAVVGVGVSIARVLYLKLDRRNRRNIPKENAEMKNNANIEMVENNAYNGMVHNHAKNEIGKQNGLQRKVTPYPKDPPQFPA